MDTSQLEKLKTIMLTKQLTIAVAESLTCGRLQAALGSISGASGFFEGGITTYNINQKTRLLGVDKGHAKTVNSISQQVAFELAEGVSKLFQSDIGIGTTGYAEASPENNVAEPIAYIALCRCSAGKTERISGRQITGVGLNRIQMQDHVSDIALASLITYVENCESAIFAHPLEKVKISTS